MKKHESNDEAVHFTLKFIVFCTVFALVSAILFYISVYIFKNVTKPSLEISASPTAEEPIIIIDAGHGGEDGGTSGENGTVEKDLNLDIAFLLRDILTASGKKVVMTREEDILLYDRNADYKGHKKSLDLRARLEMAEEYPNSVFVSIHMNAFPDTKYSGLQVWYSKNSASSALLAKSLQDKTRELLSPENNRKIKGADSSIYLLNRIKSSAVLVECGFLSNPEECARLSNPIYRQKLALVMSSAILEFLKSESRI